MTAPEVIYMPTDVNDKLIGDDYQDCRYHPSDIKYIHADKYGELVAALKLCRSLCQRMSGGNLILTDEMIYIDKAIAKAEQHSTAEGL